MDLVCDIGGIGVFIIQDKKQFRSSFLLRLVTRQASFSKNGLASRGSLGCVIPGAACRCQQQT